MLNSDSEINVSPLNEETERDLRSISENITNQQQLGQNASTNTPIVRALLKTESDIITTINDCLKIWYKPWRKTFLSDGREYKIIYDLMESLLYYENQILGSNQILSQDKTNAIAQAVAHLVDYGNAILNLDLIIRSNNDTSSEIGPNFVTTIELFHAHIKAHRFREKLLYDYFRKDKPASENGTQATSTINYAFELPVDHQNNGQLPSSPSSPQIQQQQMNRHLGPPSERSHRASLGSNSSINTILSDGRKTPQGALSPPSPSLPIKHRISSSSSQSSHYYHLPLNNQHIPTNSDKQIEIIHMIAIIRSDAFSSNNCTATRETLLPQILTKIETLMTVPTNFEKLTNCFELLDTLLNSIEKLPSESRSTEVNMIAKALLKPIVRKVHLDDRESLIEFQHAHWTTSLISIIRMMNAIDFSNYLKTFNSFADVGAFLKDYLFIVKRLISTSNSQQKPNRNVHATPFGSVNISPRTYESYWIEMTLLACKTFSSSLIYLYQILRQHFSPNSQMWLNFIDCLLHFILQDTLHPDRVMVKERQKRQANDLRQSSAEYVWISWDSLNLDQKQQLLEELIDPLTKACMVLKSKQRSILLPIFHDMMLCDYTSQYITPRGSIYGGSIASNSTTTSSMLEGTEYIANSTAPAGTGYVDHSQMTNLMKSTNKPIANPSVVISDSQLPYLSYKDISSKSEDGTVLTKFTHLIVYKLNTLLIELDSGDELFKDELCAAIAGELNPIYHNRNSFSNSSDSRQFKSMAKHTSELIAEFMQICLDCRQANKLSYGHLYLLTIFKLILFFRDKVDIVELYLHYLYKLFFLHHAAGRCIEAGYTLLEHAKILPWSDKQLENHYRIITRLFQTQQPLTDYISLKLFLYNTIMEYFDQGQLWEAAIPLGRELIDFYQFKTFEYGKLAVVYQKMSYYFKNIVEMSRSRNLPEHFRVTFYGAGFLDCLRNVTMVYRGKPFEKLGDFQQTMLVKYPDAKLLNSLSPPDEKILNDPDSKFMQINACSPIVDIQTKFGQQGIPTTKKLDESLIIYHKFNECDKFCFSRRIDAPLSLKSGDGTKSSQDNFANMWREKTILSTNTLPGLLSFFPVYLIESSIVSPIESAIEDLERINDGLSNMVNRFQSDKRQVEDVRRLSQLLLGTIDAAVNGGITKYEEAFFTSPTDQSKVALGASTLASNFDNLCINPNGVGNLMRNTNNKQAINNQQQQQQSTFNVDSAQRDKLKYLIASQIPLLDEAMRLHRDRVEEVMKPQHERLEECYKKLKSHVLAKYSKYLPNNCSRSSSFSSSTLRSYRSLARSPNRSIRSESKLPLNCSDKTPPIPPKRMSDAGQQSPLDITMKPTNLGQQQEHRDSSESSIIPYRQFGGERRSLPPLTDIPINYNPQGSASPVNYNPNATTNLNERIVQNNSELLTPDSGLCLNHNSITKGYNEDKISEDNLLNKTSALAERHSNNLDNNRSNQLYSDQNYVRLYSEPSLKSPEQKLALDSEKDYGCKTNAAAFFSESDQLSDGQIDRSKQEDTDLVLL